MQLHVVEVIVPAPQPFSLPFPALPPQPAPPFSYGGEPRERWTRQVEKAKAFLMSKELENERVKLLCETQVLMEQYVDIRHKMHEPYRVWRAASPAMLYNDFSRAAGIHDFVEDGSTLINACNRGQVNVVKRFLDNGVSVNHQNSANGCTGVYMAAVNGHVDVLHTLVECVPLLHGFGHHAATAVRE